MFGPITKFVLAAYEEGLFAEEHTPEELLEKLLLRPGADGIFLRHATKTALANTTVCEALAGKLKAGRLEGRGEYYLQDRFLAEPLEKRLASVIGEAKWWDHQREQAA